MVFGFLIEPNENLPGGAAPANDDDDVEWLQTKNVFQIIILTGSGVFIFFWRESASHSQVKWARRSLSWSVKTKETLSFGP